MHAALHALGTTVKAVYEGPDTTISCPQSSLIPSGSSLLVLTHYGIRTMKKKSLPDGLSHEPILWKYGFNCFFP